MFAPFFIAVAVAFTSYGSTPSEVMVKDFGPLKPARIEATRTNIVGRYATVVARGAKLEGDPLKDAVLFEHFSFGWQAIGFPDIACRTRIGQFTAGDAVKLMAGMPKQTYPPDCRGYSVDSGPASGIEKVRAQMQGPLVPTVVVIGNYAMGAWSGLGGGQTLFHNVSGFWHRIDGGGGQMGAEQLRQHHVPPSDWCRLLMIDPKCPA